MMTLPLVLRGDARPFVVIGGGAVAARKVRTLVQAGASVRVIAPQLHADIQALASQIALEQRPATAAEVFAADSLLVLATDNPQLNAALAESGRRTGKLSAGRWQHCGAGRSAPLYAGS